MKDHWNVECSKCGLTLRLTVEEEDIGRTVEAICPECKTKTKTTIGVPVLEEDFRIPPKLEQKMAELAEKITTDPEIAGIVGAIRDEGFGVMLAMGIYKKTPNNEAVETPIPKVDENGEVKAGTFTKEDEENFKKCFKIEL